MMRHVTVNRRAVLAALAAGAVAGCGRAGGLARGGHPPGAAAQPIAAGAAPSRVARPVVASAPAALAVSRAQVVAGYGRLTPHYWGFGAPGVLRRLATNQRVIALTFDACGGPGGSGYDAALISYLRRHEVPATLFLNSRWIDANWAVFARLRAEPLFELANHGTRHLPLSVTGRSAYGIGGTRNAGQVYDEVAGNQVKLTRLLGARPRFFRAGTACPDDVAAQRPRSWSASRTRMPSAPVRAGRRPSAAGPAGPGPRARRASARPAAGPAGWPRRPDRCGSAPPRPRRCSPR
jgi:peptidoglycan/xylan/chitin deacetylase (PgdA/CDA1 family)